jgi:acyl-CoA synthetase (NDP forming)
VHKVYKLALRAVLNDPNADGVICIAISPKLPEFNFLDIAEPLNRVMEEEMPSKPVIAWVYGPNTPEIADRLESKKRIMVYPSLDIASWSLSLLRDRYKILQR